ncbi:MAG: hypothetical protein BGO78_01750 [Chloroflexi bacterium 44-23]|nr:MAG: hypothetical protein BGO78_01750 [Chloroflexi bacterium 44-23]
MVIIFADTTSSIPVDEAKILGIEYLPQFIIFGEETFRDDTELDSATFIKKLIASSTLPKTSAPPPQMYQPLFEKHLKAGNDIIVLTPSANVSGTYRSAEMASQEFIGEKITIIDTLNIGASFASLVKTAVQMANNGESSDTIVATVKNMVERERNIFVVDTLEYLYKGGRIGGAKMLFGSLLQVKPLLALKRGQVEPVESQRTKKKAVSRMIELIIEECPPKNSSLLSIQHGAALADAQKLAQQLKEALNLDEVPIYNLPPAFLVHSGPGVLGTSYFID